MTRAPSTRSVALLVALCATLGALGSWHLAHDRAHAPNAPTITRLAQPVVDRKATVAAITITAARDVVWTCVRTKGRWRAREAEGAYLEPALFDPWLADLLDARALPLTDEPSRANAYGLGTPSTVRVSLHGPKVLDAADRDVYATFELASQGSRSFARREGAPTIYELDRDLLTPLEPLNEQTLLPLIDTHLLAATLEPGASGFTTIELTPRTGEPLTLRLEPTRTQDNLPRYTLLVGPVPHDCLPWRAGAFMGLLLRGHATNYAPRSRANSLGLETPDQTIVLTPDQGEPITLRLSPTTGPVAYLLNERTNLLMQIPSSMHDDLLPSPADFLDATRANRWERYLASMKPEQH